MKKLSVILLIFFGLIFAAAVFGQSAPADPVSLSQYKLDCSTSLPPGAWTNEPEVCLKGDISDPDALDNVKLQAELLKNTETFVNTPNQIASSYCVSPCTSMLNVSSLINGSQYKWQAQSLDQEGRVSNWVEFNNGQNAFGVDLDSPQGAMSISPREVRINQKFNIVVKGQDTIDMGAVGYKEEKESNWHWSACQGISLSCTNSFERSEGTVGKYVYYGLIADAADNSANTDPINIPVLVETDPLARTDSATNVGTAQAILNGEVLDMGGAEKIEVWFQYGPSTSYGSESIHRILSAAGPFIVTVGGLLPGTAYHFRAVVKNGVGTAYGADAEFVTFVELIQNGDFETGNLNPWKSSGQGDHTISSGDTHAGSYSAEIGFNTTPPILDGVDAVYQEVQIPSGATNINLSLWYKFYTNDKCPYDYMNIYLKDTSNNILKSYLEQCCQGCTAGQLHTFGWNQITDNDLSALAGQTVRIYFEVKNGYDAFHSSWGFIDDVSIRYIPTYLPSVKTNPASAIKTTEVVLNGELLDMGRADSVEVWFRYGTTKNYGQETAHVFKNNTGPFSVYLTGLTPDTTYHFRAAARNGSGISNGVDLQFTTLFSAAGGWILADSIEDPQNRWVNEPLASDNDALSFAEDRSNNSGWGPYIVFNLNTPTKSNKVRVNADFTPNKYRKTDMVQVDILYENDADFTTVFQGAIQNCFWSEIPYNEGKVTKARFRWHYKLSGNYIYWLYEFQFYKVPDSPVTLPANNTTDPTSIEEDSAVLHGQVTDDGGETVQYGFEYGPTQSYGISTPWEGSLATGKTFGRMVTGLQEGITYHFRAEVKNSAGINLGADNTFFTQAAKFGWVSPTSYDPSTSWENQHLTFDDELESYARVYHELSAADDWSPYIYLTHKEISLDKIRFYARGAPQVNQIKVDLYKDGSWQTVYNGAFADRTWTTVNTSAGKVSQARIRFHAANNTEGFYFQLYEFDFWKLQQSPSVNTLSATDIGSAQATLNGELTDLGGSDSAQVWFEYVKDDGTPWSSANTTSYLTKMTTGIFLQTVQNLTSATNYKFRAVAKNDSGTTYGSEKSFTTQGSCVKGSTKNCTSEEGCTHQIECDAKGAWPPCPRDYCNKDENNSTDCPCPAPKCQGNDWVYYGDYFSEGDPKNFCGDCNSNCLCNVSTNSGQPCQEHIEYNSLHCNQPPTASNIDVYLTDWCYCTTDIEPKFSWQYSDPEEQRQDSYQVQISTDLNFNPMFIVIDSCVSPEPNTCAPGNSSQEYRPITNLAYNTTYYSRLKVKDAGNAWSDWVVGPSFKTTPHRWPRPDFIFRPIRPSVKEMVLFTDISRCYDLNNNAYPCKEINPITGQNNIYSWDFGDGTFSSANSTTSHAYSKTGEYLVKLLLADLSLKPESGECPIEYTIIVSQTLPSWKEISP